MKEIWKAIKNYPMYEVSNKGKIRSFHNTFLSESGLKIPRTSKLTKSDSRYYVINLYSKGRFKKFYVHSLVLKTFVGSRPKDFVCNHKDGIKTNNNLSNLEWISRSDDVNHAYRVGLQPIRNRKGRKNPRARLDDNKVKEIKGLLAKGISQTKIGRIFNVSRGCISSISIEQTWKHITI